MKTQRRWEIPLQERLKQRDIAKGIRSSEPATKGLRRRRRKKYIVFLPENNEITNHRLTSLDLYAYSSKHLIKWLNQKEIVELKLSGHIVEPYDENKFWTW